MVRIFLADDYSLEGNKRLASLVDSQGFDRATYESSIRPYLEAISRSPRGSMSSPLNFFRPVEYQITSLNFHDLQDFLKGSNVGDTVEMCIAPVNLDQGHLYGFYKITRDKHGSHDSVRVSKAQRSLVSTIREYMYN